MANIVFGITKRTRTFANNQQASLLCTYIHTYISIHSKRTCTEWERDRRDEGKFTGRAFVGRETRWRKANSFIADCRITRARIHAEFGMYALLNCGVSGANSTLSTSRVSYPPSYLDITVGGCTDPPPRFLQPGLHDALLLLELYIWLGVGLIVSNFIKKMEGSGRGSGNKARVIRIIININIWVTLYK